MTAAGQPDLFTKRVRKPPPASEFSLHVMTADVLGRWISPGWIFTHLASGEHRNKVTAARLKRMGLKPGWPDFVLLSPTGQAHFLELKRRGGRLSESQRDFADWCAEYGCTFAVADDFDSALAILREWGAVRTSVHA